MTIHQRTADRLFTRTRRCPTTSTSLCRCGTRAQSVARKLMRALCHAIRASSYNDRHGTRGPVFQRPFRGKLIRDGDHIANTFAYIHLNPDASLRTDKQFARVLRRRLDDDPHIDPSLAWKAFGGRAGYIEFLLRHSPPPPSPRSRQIRLDQ